MNYLLALAMVVFLVALPGCATGLTEGVCAFGHMGQNEAGVQFVRFKCVPE